MTWSRGSVWLDEAGAVVLASPAARRWLDLLDAQAYPGFARTLAGGPGHARGRRGRAGHRGTSEDGRRAMGLAVALRNFQTGVASALSDITHT
jgi:hypothetical protein